MIRKPRYPQSRAASVVAAAFVAAIVGIAIPASVTGLFQSRGLPWAEAAATPVAVVAARAADTPHVDQNFTPSETIQ